MPKIEKIENEKLRKLLGSKLFEEWSSLLALIYSKYEMNEEWHTANKGADFELKIRRGGKTLISLFPNFPEKNSIGVMIIFGKEERGKFEERRESFSEYVVVTYEDAKTFHDGKWVMFKAPNEGLTNDLLDMLLIKRKPNIK